MCRRVVCDECKKPTYAGCGMHIEQVLGDVPKEARCACRDGKSTKAPDGGWSAVRRLFGV